MTEAPAIDYMGPCTMRHLFWAWRRDIQQVERLSPQPFGVRIHQQSSKSLVRSRDIDKIFGENVAEYLKENMREFNHTRMNPGLTSKRTSYGMSMMRLSRPFFRAVALGADFFAA